MNLWQAWRVSRRLSKAERIKVHPVWWVRLWMRWESDGFYWLGLPLLFAVAAAIGLHGLLYLLGEGWSWGTILFSGCGCYIGGVWGWHRFISIPQRVQRPVRIRYEELRQVHEGKHEGGELTEVKP